MSGESGLHTSFFPMTRLSALLLAVPLMLPGAVRALIVANNPSVSATQNNTPPTGLTSQWNAVVVNGASNSIYLGNGWFIAPYHVGAGQVTVNGVNYTPDPNSVRRLANPVTGDLSDLNMFQISADPGITGVTLASKAPAVGDTLTFISTGRYRSANFVYYSVNKTDPNNWVWTQVSGAPYDYVGYSVTGSYAKLWGTNKVIAWDAAGNASGTFDTGGVGVNQAFATDFAALVNEAAGFSGDSGGGVFNSAGELVGILDAAGFDDTIINPPANTVIFNWYYSIMLDIPEYAPTINLVRGTPVAVPEAGGVVLVGPGVMMLRRVRRGGVGLR
jgi:hypothetical protein